MEDLCLDGESRIMFGGLSKYVHLSNFVLLVIVICYSKGFPCILDSKLLNEILIC